MRFHGGARCTCEARLPGFSKSHSFNLIEYIEWVWLSSAGAGLALASPGSASLIYGGAASAVDGVGGTGAKGGRLHCRYGIWF
jgi:hypothetical protein